MIAFEHDYWNPEKCGCPHCVYTKAKEFMSQKQQNQSDFISIDRTKLLILVNERVHHNWMSGVPLNEGIEWFSAKNPEDWKNLMNAYERMNEALGNPPIKSSRCCGGACGCHGE